MGQSDAAIADILLKNGFTPREATQNPRSKTRSNRYSHQQFETPGGDKLDVQIGTPDNNTGPGQIVSIHYAPASEDDGLALEKRLRTQFGAPLARYSLENETQLFVWERPAPVQSREFGPLMNISLRTGKSPKLSINQFNRPAGAGGVTPAAPRKAARAKARPAARQALIVQSGPVN